MNTHKKECRGLKLDRADKWHMQKLESSQTSHLTNHSRKTSKTYGTLQEKRTNSQEMFSDGLLHMDESVLADQLHLVSTQNSLHQFCVDTRCSPENLLEAIVNREG